MIFKGFGRLGRAGNIEGGLTESWGGGHAPKWEDNFFTPLKKPTIPGSSRYVKILPFGRFLW